MHPRYTNPNCKGELKVTCSLEGAARRVAHLIVICVYTRKAVSPSPFLCTPVPPSLHSRPLTTKQNVWFPRLEPCMGLPSHFVFMPVRTLASRHGWYLASSPARVLLTSSSFSLLWLHPVPPACSHLWIFMFVWRIQSVLLAPPSLLWISASVSPSQRTLL